MMADKAQLNVTILTPEKLIYRGRAESVVLPGEKGVFEILPHHKRLLSRLLGGTVFVDGKKMQIRRGVAKVALNEVTIIVEEQK
jgi:F-type H+-transporting ATPase subunit epsilon